MTASHEVAPGKDISRVPLLTPSSKCTIAVPGAFGSTPAEARRFVARSSTRSVGSFQNLAAPMNWPKPKAELLGRLCECHGRGRKTGEHDRDKSSHGPYPAVMNGHPSDGHGSSTVSAGLARLKRAVRLRASASG